MTFVQALISALFSHHVARIVLFCSPLGLLIFYRLYFHPLSHIPGPLTARITGIHLYIICFLGIECRLIQRYHRKCKTSVLRIAPNTVSISDSAALQSIYISGGGFQKTTRYENFKVDGVHTIFSSRETGYRDVRAKTVAPLFAMGRIRAASAPDGIIGRCTSRFVQRFEDEKRNAMILAPEAARIDILALTYRFMMDSVTGYLFNRTYGALDEQPPSPSSAKDPSSATSQHNTMSALPFIFAILEAGRFSLMPNWVFTLSNSILQWLSPSSELGESLDHVHKFASSITNDAVTHESVTYQSRLLAAGISEKETIAQCVAVMFAGTDSSAVMFVTIIFHLVQNPSVLVRLRQELNMSGEDPDLDLQNLAFLRAVVQEGLRLGMANPARFSRVVPPEGLQVGNINIPGNTDVGLAPYVLHHDSEYFPEPYRYRPERWLDEGKGRAIHIKEMQKMLIPFSIGSRACIAKNFATYELFAATKAIVMSGVLEGATTCTETIDLKEYFNASIKNHKLEIEWST